MTTSPLTQLRTLDKQRLRLLEDAKAELIRKIDKDLELLRGLGFDYAISTRAPKKKKRKANGEVKAKSNGKAKPNGRLSQGHPCSVCGFVTEKPHDARSHRWQKPKAPFNARELVERGMVKV